MSEWSVELKYKEILEKVAAACQRSGRELSSVKILGASKAQPVERLKEAYNAGLRLFGENRLQELEEKVAALPKDTEWHFIGKIQRRKVVKIIPHVTLIHALDSINLAEEIDLRSKVLGKITNCLIQVNIDQEETKGGIKPDQFEGFVKDCGKFPSVRILGLMAIPKPHKEEDRQRASFKEMKRLADRLKEILSIQNLELSMGMSEDFDVAIEEGATIIRLGSSLFGPRP